MFTTVLSSRVSKVSRVRVTLDKISSSYMLLA